MERLKIDELIAHCDRQLKRVPSGTICYQEHESVRAYLQILRHYQKAIGDTYDLSRLKELVDADRDGRFTEVVRCKDCKYYYKIPMSIPVCILSDHEFRKPDDFCSYGKREAAEKALEELNG